MTETFRLAIEIERGWLEHASMRHALRGIRRRCVLARAATLAGGLMSAQDLADVVEQDVTTVLNFVDAEDEE